jgi:ADP-heptose:LPS heptosyltransferase
MRISTMRLVDRWLGIPVCGALTVLRHVRDRARAPAPAPPCRIVFVKLAEQGSTVLACSAIRRAVELVGREHVFFLAFEQNRFILDVMALIPPANLVTIDANGVLATVAGAVAALRRLRRLGVDVAIDLEFFARSSAALAYLSGATSRVGLHAFGGAGPYRGDLMTHRLLFNPHLHTSQTFRLMVDALASPPDRLPTFDGTPPAADDPPPPFLPAAHEIDAVRSLLRAAGLDDDDGPLVLLNPNCSDLLPLRAWPASRYGELASRLLACNPRVRIVMTGAAAERAAVEGLVRAVGSARCVSVAGHTTLRELLVLYALADVLVTNDSGPAHFATLTPLDVVTLFGPEHPELFAARSLRSRVLWAGVPCSPCVNAFNNRTSPCRNNVCMQRITVDQVFAAVVELLECRAFQRRQRLRSLAGSPGSAH